MYCFLQMKKESKQNKTDLTYLDLAHIQRSLHHHLNIQQMKQGHLMLAVHVKGIMMGQGWEEREKREDNEANVERHQRCHCVPPPIIDAAAFL